MQEEMAVLEATEQNRNVQETIPEQKPNIQETSIEQDITAGELADEMRGRAAFYRFLSDAFLHEFTAEQIAAMKGIAAPAGVDPQIAEGFDAIRRYLSRAGADPRTDLACEYARVFLSAGVYDGLTAEPYESVFTSDDHILMQDARDEVVHIYRENGIDVDASLHMPEDHMGLELEFLALMADRTAKAIETVRATAPAAPAVGAGASPLVAAPAGSATASNIADSADADIESILASDDVATLIETQRAFVENHILNWADALAEKVDEFAKLPFYPAIMRILKGYVTDDRAALEALSTPIVA